MVAIISNAVATAARLRAARAGYESMLRADDDRYPIALRTAFGDLLGAVEGIAAVTPESAQVASSIVGEVEAERADRDRLKAEAFDRIAAFVGVAGLEGGASAAALLTEVGNLCASVHGVPNPNAEDTAHHYRRIAPGLLTKKQRRLVGLGEGDRVGRS